MKKIKDLAWWFGWFKQTHPVPSFAIAVLVLVLAALASIGVRNAIESGHLGWVVLSAFGMLIALVVAVFFFSVGSSFKYRDDSRNWRLAVDKAWTFANKDQEAFSEIQEWIKKTIATKNPEELNDFMENWKSPTQKKLEFIEKLGRQKHNLKGELERIEDIMSGKRAEQIREEIKKIDKELRGV